MRPFRLPPTASGYESPDLISKSRGRRSQATQDASHNALEALEEQDQVHGLRNERIPGVLTNLDGRFNQSATSVGSRRKADKMLGLDANAKLASLYLVSGLGKSTAQWAFADTDATRGIQPLEDSLGFWWRPEMLGSSFSGERPDDHVKDRMRKESKASTLTNGLSKDIRGKHVPNAGPDGAQRLVSKTMKFAHPRDVEVVNSTLSPPTTCHSFSFTIPRHDTLAAVARTRLDNAVSAGLGGNANLSMISTVDENSTLDINGAPNVRSITSATELTFHGVTLCVWTHADKDRALHLKAIKLRAERTKMGHDSLSSMTAPVGLRPTRASTGTIQKNSSKRSSLSAIMGSRNKSDADITASETETGMSDSDLDGPLGKRALRSAFSDRLSTVDSLPDDAAAAYDEASDIFWMPYAITIVSRFPIYDVLQDYLRLSWARFSKNAKVHMSQVCRLLNYDPPRPGEGFHIPVGLNQEDEVVVEAHMPGGLMDFDKGLMKVDFQLWPLFQAIDLDHILTCAEVALSNSGRIIFCSKHPAMLGVAVSTLHYIVEVRGWDGIAMPVMHARDATFIIEDPGPYIIGISTECRYLIAPPAEVVIVDLDTNSLACKSPPAGVITPRTRREKAKLKLLAALGHHYPRDRSIPMEFKVSYPKGAFRHFNRITYHGERPLYLGDRIRAPTWWRHEAVIPVFDKILAEKHKKPSLIQRLTKTGIARAQAQLTVGEQLVKAMMRRRALHYVETRDDLELKVAKINRRLLKLIQEGEHWKQQFEIFEKYADRLTIEANELKTKIEKERREARRLSSIANEQTRQNLELEEKLKATETARAEAMRQLSDMHHSIQELEREREEIMNTIEAQISGALAGLPGTSVGSDTSSRPATPGDAMPEILGSPKSRSSRLRPVTGDSQRSVMSRMTSDTHTVSVLGHVNGVSRRKAGTITSSVAATERIGNLGRADSMAQRVANIQAKLELALNTVSSQRSTSVMTNASLLTDSASDREDPATDTDTDTGTEHERAYLGSSEIGAIVRNPAHAEMSNAIAGGESDVETSSPSETPIASRMSSLRNARGLSPSPVPPLPVDRSKPNDDGSVAIQRLQPHHDADQNESVEEAPTPSDPNLITSQLISSRIASQGRVPLRPKRRESRSPSISPNETKCTNHKSIAYARDSREIVLSPSLSNSSKGSEEGSQGSSVESTSTAGMKVRPKKPMTEDSNRLSTLSTTTVTFGP